MTKKTFLAVLLAVLVCGGAFSLVSCGSDDNSDTAAGQVVESVNVNSLIGKRFVYNDQYLGGDTNIETQTIEVIFLSKYFVRVSFGGSGIDLEGSYRWDNGTSDCAFTVSGNKVIINFEGEDDFKKTFSMTFNGSQLVSQGWFDGGEYKDIPTYPNLSGEATAGSNTLKGCYAEGFSSLASSHFAGTIYGEERDYDGEPVINIKGNYKAEYVPARVCNYSLASNESWTLLAKYNNWLYVYSFFADVERLAYVVVGDQILFSNGKLMTIENNSLVEGTRKWEKL